MKYSSKCRFNNDEIHLIEEQYKISIEEFAARRNAERIIRDMSFDDLKKLFKFESYGITLSSYNEGLNHAQFIEYINSINIPE